MAAADGIRYILSFGGLEALIPRCLDVRSIRLDWRWVAARREEGIQGILTRSSLGSSVDFLSAMFFDEPPL